MDPETIISAAEEHPAGLLVLCLIGGLVWMSRRLAQATKERQRLAAALMRAADDGAEVDDETTAILGKLGQKRIER